MPVREALIRLRFWVEMGVYLSTPKTEKFSEDGEGDRLRYGLSSMQGWRATMEDAHAAYPNLDSSTSFFGVYDGHGGKVVAKFCAKYLHQQVLKEEAYSAGEIGTSVQKAFFRCCSSIFEFECVVHSNFCFLVRFLRTWFIEF